MSGDGEAFAIVGAGVRGVRIERKPPPDDPGAALGFG